MGAEALRFHPRLDVKSLTGGGTLTQVYAYGYRSGEVDQAACARLLVDAAGGVDHRNRNGQTALFGAITPEEVNDLLALGADVNVRDNDGRTPIFKAGVDAIPQLVAHGADLTVRDRFRRTAFQEGGPEARKAMVRALVQRDGLMAAGQETRGAELGMKGSSGRAQVSAAGSVHCVRR